MPGAGSISGFAFMAAQPFKFQHPPRILVRDSIVWERLYSSIIGLTLNVSPVRTNRHSATHCSPGGDAFLAAADIETFLISGIKISGKVPSARGLGSSVTVRLGVLLGLNVLAGSPLTRNQIYQVCSELEGHPDNAAAALYGGFVVVNKSGNQVHRFDVDSSVTFVLLIPDLEVRTI